MAFNDDIDRVRKIDPNVQPARIEADTTAQVSLGLDFAARRKAASQQPPVETPKILTPPALYQ